MQEMVLLDVTPLGLGIETYKHRLEEDPHDKADYMVHLLSRSVCCETCLLWPLQVLTADHE